ncbi:SusC/RagA family TonB-linked outer membrane protein [Dysgonomonas sp. Marseille-P4677]|uniref:SusC/RagA family TonB-linked outer membrane protein n=1 Tax=Dysgonomonas sp. Marseille-P4677 TaxID=2364790 RepID=UPI0019117680|nr:SusC/RagA family TonB-linked outer membrane protein [Dysgonomonas sp. Marseille-P4677]MBK5722741.1 SusC/RagA family TonB-linked outer membrane protein [Dysgonomonas sp. Marseille-P4677]
MKIITRTGVFVPKNVCPKQLLRVMKIISFFLIVFVFCLNAGNLSSQNVKVTLNQNNVTLETILNKIESQTDYLFVYDKSINKDRLVSVVETEQTLASILKKLFENTNVSYFIEGSNIVLSTKKVEPSAITQQQRIITGTIVDEAGEIVIGASISIVGTTKGTFSDIDGRFEIALPAGMSKLTISLIGMETYELTVGSQNNYNIVLKNTSVTMDEVVVTALGIRREEKALTYNVQEIKAEELTTVKDANFVNSLAGKVAGITINQSASGIGGSSRVVMRGTKSIIGDNNALYVIDGVPIYNTKNDQPEGPFESPDGGDGDAMSLLNPEDIESISVLSGAASAALYGSQGANGVILVTTRKGKEGRLRLNYSNSTIFMSPFVSPKFQNTYGTKGTEFNSWGGKLDTPTSYDPMDFFQTGYTETNSLSMTAGNGSNQTYASVSSLIARGIIPNNDLRRINLTVNNTTNLLKDKLTLDFGFSYVNQKDENMMAQGQYHNPLVPLYLFPRGDDIEKYKVYERHDAGRNFAVQYWPYGNQGLGMQNPYWIVNKEAFKNRFDRYSISGALTYKPLDWLTLNGRALGIYTYNTFNREISASADLLFASDNGNYMHRETNNRQLYADFLAVVDKRFNDDFNLTGVLGTSMLDYKYRQSGAEGHLNTVPDFFYLGNIDLTHPESRLIQKRSEEQTQAVFATAQLGYKSMLYLDVTARNEWSSALAYTTHGTNFFYPSVGLSGIINEMTNLGSAVSFLKIRGSYSEVGNAPLRYITKRSYGLNQNGSLNLLPFFPATGLKPERTKAYEVGLNSKFLNNMLSLDVTYYNTNTYNQLFDIAASTTSGYSYYYLNAGKVNNQGVEISLGLDKKFGEVQWNSNFTYTLNRNTVKELVAPGTIDPTTNLPMENGMNEVIVNEHDSYRMVVREGDAMGDIYVYTLKKDLNGDVYVDPVNGTVSADTKNWVRAGNSAPKYNLGFQNTFNYKGFSLGFLFDARIGGVGVSATQALMDRYGVSQASAEARDAGGVMLNGGLVNPENYYGVVSGGTTGVLSEYVYSMTNVRLREASLSYALPPKLLKGYLKNVTLSVIGRNLWMIYNKAPFDPEITASTGTYYQGFDYFMQPSLRSFGFNVKVEF